MSIEEMKKDEILEDENFFDEECSEEEDVVEYDITTSPGDWSPANIVELIDSGIMELPLFQRNYVWDIKKASKLVESLILGLPVPELFVYMEDDSESTYKIIDGQQRILSVYFYIKGRFPKKAGSRILFREKLRECANLDELLADNNNFRDFALKLNDGTESKPSRYNGKKYTELDKDTQIKLRLRRFMRAIVVRQNKPENSSASMFEIFNRLNTGGVKLNNQEIRASLYYCDFYEMITRLNSHHKWRSLLGKPTQDLHSEDIELILRSFALLQEGENYSPKMVSFLNSFSQKSKSFSEEYIDYLEKLFLSFLDACKSLKPRAFFRYNKFSKTLFESVFIASCAECYDKRETLNASIDSESFEKLKNNAEFTSYSQNSSTSRESVIRRLQIAYSLIKLNKEN
ncbi:MAG: DUF262 domain-containing protein [Ruminococcus sp.]|nr:DUF262 domain-containing protein [Ruminococcus sp.]